jgi:CheY-like chemotaxis protein
MTSRPNILYMDDESELLVLATSFFADESLEIDTCGSISEALKKIKHNRYDLIISDAGMTSQTGQAFLNQLRHEYLFQGKFIMVTGNLEFEYFNHDGCDLVLFKPIRFQDLVLEAKKLLLI